jgi:hypothetical protein
MMRRATMAGLCVVIAALAAGCGSSSSKTKTGPAASKLSVSTQTGVTNFLAAWGVNYGTATSDLTDSVPSNATTGASATMWINTTVPAYRQASKQQLIGAVAVNAARQNESARGVTLSAKPSPALLRALRTIEKESDVTLSAEPSTTFSFFLPTQQDAVTWQRKLTPLLPQDGRAQTAYGGFLYVSWPGATSITAGGSKDSMVAALNTALGAVAANGYSIADIKRVLGAHAAQVAKSLEDSATASGVAAGTSTDQAPSGSVTTGTTT